MGHSIEKYSDSDLYSPGQFQTVLDTVDLMVSKRYLEDLRNCTPAVFSDDDASFDDLAFVKIDKIVYRNGEDVNDKLVSVFGALFSHNSSALLLIMGQPTGVEFYLGIRDSSQQAVYEGLSILTSSVQGNFPGVHFSECTDLEVENLMCEAFPDSYSLKAMSSVTIVPGSRDEDKKNFVQGIEKFIEGMEGKSYTAFLLASPVSVGRLAGLQATYEDIYTELSPMQQVQQQLSENESLSVAQGATTSCSKSINEGLSDTFGTSKSDTKGTSRSRDSHHGFGMLLFNTSSGGSRGSSQSSTYGTNENRTTSHSETETATTGTTETETATVGATKGVTLTRKNKVIDGVLENIDSQLERIKSCQAYGLWEVGCYFVSKFKNDAIVAANTFKATVSGDDSHVESAYVNVWSNSRDDYNGKLERIFDYLRVGQHPVFEYEVEDEDGFYSTKEIQAVSLVSGKELPLILGLPRHSVNGLTAIESAEFGRNVFKKSGGKPRRYINFGAISYLGAVNKSNRVLLDVDRLSAHCFVTGSTGSGKSNTTYHLLDELIEPRNGIKFLVIEPAKGEYKKQYGKLKGINIYTTNPRFNDMLRINPFYFPEGAHVLEHLDRVIEIFSACWPLYAAMPALLKKSFEQAYVMHGWDLAHSIHIDVGNGMYPTFHDIAELLPRLLEDSAFSGDTKGDYIGSLVTRVESLTNGLVGQIFTENPISNEKLFDENTIVDLSRVGSTETKAVIMGTLILLLSEHRQTALKGPNQPLSHVTILEEAHNLLKRTSTEQGQESANLQGKSVEMISNSIAEMRTYGEGFIIVDQSPSAVDISAIKNTNTKIVMSLPEKEDRESAGKSMGLDDDQILEIAKLPVGSAITYQSDWLEPVLVKIDRCSEEYVREKDKTNERAMQIKSRGEIACELFRQKDSGKFDSRPVIKLLGASPLKADEKKLIITACSRLVPKNGGALSNSAFNEVIALLADCDYLFEILAPNVPETKAKEPLSRTQQKAYAAWRRSAEEALDQYVVVDSDIKKRVIDAVLTNIAAKKKHHCWKLYYRLKSALIATMKKRV